MKVLRKDWVSHLRMKANNCKYKDCNRKLKEQFINGKKG